VNTCVGDCSSSSPTRVETSPSWLKNRRRLGRDVAERLVNSIRAGIARVENTLLSDPEAAASTRAAFPDQDFSIVDRTSWSVMIRLGVPSPSTGTTRSIGSAAAGGQAFTVHS